MQKPHCRPAVETNDSLKISFSASGIPSTVQTSLLSALAASITHETTALPSSRTVQQPHCPCGAQPFLGEIRSHSSRSRSISVVPAVTFLRQGAPLSVKDTDRVWLGLDPPLSALIMDSAGQSLTEPISYCYPSGSVQS